MRFLLTARQRQHIERFAYFGEQPTVLTTALSRLRPYVGQPTDGNHLFLAWDSEGLAPGPRDAITEEEWRRFLFLFIGKCRFGQCVSVLREWRNDRYGWIGGRWLVSDPITPPVAALFVEAFGAETVLAWMGAALADALPYII